MSHTELMLVKIMQMCVHALFFKQSTPHSEHDAFKCVNLFFWLSFLTSKMYMY